MNSSAVDVLSIITLVGSPNSGKTSLFNLLSGKNYKTVNYPGATVEYSICKLQDKFGITGEIIDSPGIISLVPNSPDEEVSVNALYNHPLYGSPDLIIATVDASQLSRHLLLVKQLIDCRFDVIVALTMNDIFKKRGYEVNEELLSKELGCEVVKVDGRTGFGLQELLDTVRKKLNKSEITSKHEITKFSELPKDELLKIYAEIGVIENKVIHEVNGYTDSLLEKANKQLNIINPTLRPSRNKPDSFTLKLDKYLLHKKLGMIFFFLIMSIVFTSIFWIAAPFMELIDGLFGSLAAVVTNNLGETWFSNLLSDGIISGTGAVLVFLPQILILFIILGLLEDTGYLARGAMLIDKPLSKIGLNGKSFVPMLSGFACAIPAMLAARTISNRKERLLTIFIIPLMSCSARLPVYALLLAFLTPADKPWLGGLALASIYIFSIISSLVVAAVINKFSKNIIRAKDESSFILELPAYRVPKLMNVFRNSVESAKQYLLRAGPVILGLSLVLWLLMYFPNHTPDVDTSGLNHEEAVQLIKAERLSTSYASDLGKFIQPVMTPIGMDWRVGVSLIAAFAAREVFVSSLALIFKVTDEENLQSSILTAMRNATIGDTDQKLFTPATITGLIIFFVFALQCLSTVAVSRKETGSWRIPMLQILLFTSLAYFFTFLTVNGLRFFGIN